MNNLAKQVVEQSEGPVQAGKVLRVTWIIIGAAGPTALVYLYLAWQSGAWQLYGAAGSVLAFLAACFGGIGIIRRGRPMAGAKLLLASLMIVFVVFAGLIGGFGLPLAVTMVLLTALNAGQILAPAQVSRAIIISSILGIGMIMLDLLPLGYRYPIPAILQTYIPVLLGILILIQGVFIAREFANFSLRTKLIIGFVVVGAFSVTSVAFFNNRDTQAALTSRANQSLLASAAETAGGLEVFIETNLAGIEAEAKLPALARYLMLPAERRAGSAEEAEVLSILRALGDKDRAFITSYALLDRQGWDVADSYTQDIGLDKSNRSYFQAALNTNLPYASDVEFSRVTGEPFIYFSSPVRDSSEQIIGVLRVRYDATILTKIIEQNKGLAGAESFAILLDENYVRLAHGTDPELNFKSVMPLEPAKVAELQAARRLPDRPVTELSTNLPELAEGLRGWEGQPFFSARLVVTGDEVNSVAVSRLRTRPWFVVFAQPEEVFLAPVTAQTNRTVVVAVVIMAVVVVGAVLVGQTLANPILHLTEVTQQVTQGNLEVHAPVERQDETGQLAAAFNSMTTRLRDLIGSLEDQVRERTVELALSVEVGQRASQIRDLADLLPTITTLIRERFDLYYTQIYFVDDLGQNLVLRAGTGSVGEALVAERHSLAVGAGSIVGRVAAEGRSIVVSDTSVSTIHKPNVRLPETRSELAVPLMIEGRVIGVLDMQASRANTFTEQNLTVFEAMATQLAIAIDSAQQLASAQEARHRAEAAIRQLTRETWAETLATLPTRQAVGFTYDLTAIRRHERHEGGQRIEKGTDGEGQVDGHQRVAVPLAVQNEPIGQLTVAAPVDKRLGGDEQAFVEAVAQQLSQKAENLRLFSETQQRAAREQLARQITDKVRASRTIEQALQIAAEELARSLSAARAVIKLQVGPGQHETGNGEADKGAKEPEGK